MRSVLLIMIGMVLFMLVIGLTLGDDASSRDAAPPGTPTRGDMLVARAKQPVSTGRSDRSPARAKPSGNLRDPEPVVVITPPLLPFGAFLAVGDGDVDALDSNARNQFIVWIGREEAVVATKCAVTSTFRAGTTAIENVVELIEWLDELGLHRLSSRAIARMDAHGRRQKLSILTDDLSWVSPQTGSTTARGKVELIGDAIRAVVRRYAVKSIDRERYGRIVSIVRARRDEGIASETVTGASVWISDAESATDD